jgi:hypothetical protein
MKTLAGHTMEWSRRFRKNQSRYGMNSTRRNARSIRNSEKLNGKNGEINIREKSTFTSTDT